MKDMDFSISKRRLPDFLCFTDNYEMSVPMMSTPMNICKRKKLGDILYSSQIFNSK